MLVQPKDILELFDIKEVDNILSTIFVLLNYLKEGDCLEYGNVSITSLGNNLLYIDCKKIDKNDIEEDFSMHTINLYHC